MDESKKSFAIIFHNFRTFEGHDVVEVVRGRWRAEPVVVSWNEKLTPAQKDAGWKYFLEPTTLKPGTEPKFATEFMELDAAMRRARAQRPTKRSLKRLKHLRQWEERAAADKMNQQP